MKRIMFIDYLRSLAITLVLIEHYFGIFWFYHDSIAKDALFLPIKNLNFKSPLEFLLINQINLGYIGVGLFFLISGFVVFKSIEKRTAKQYLTRRFIRIYPTYFFVMIITLCFLFLSAHLNGIKFPFTWKNIIINFLLLQDWFYVQLIEQANWYLQVIIKFYFLIGLVLIFFKKRILEDDKSILKFGIFLFLFHLLTNFLLKKTVYKIYYGIIFTFAYSSWYLIFILLGICLYNFYHNKWTKTIFLYNFLLILLLFIVSGLIGPVFDLTKPVIIGFIFSLIIFIIFLILESKFTYSKTINFISRISYSIYLIHRINGYILLNFFIKLNIKPILAITFVTAIVVILSYVIDLFIRRLLLSLKVSLKSLG